MRSVDGAGNRSAWSPVWSVNVTAPLTAGPRRAGLSLTIVNSIATGKYPVGTTIGSFEKLASALGTSTTVMVAIIVNELVTNALKHAFADSNEGVIRVKSEQHPKGVAIIVEDNGRGLKTAAPKNSGGLGTQLVNRFARELGCEHEVVSSDNGTTHRLVMRSLA